jgi:pimeloyl-ACP methyl ester carboxylesterase
VTVPDLPAVEAYHAAATAAIDAAERSTLDSGSYASIFDLHRALADRALARVRRHVLIDQRKYGNSLPVCVVCIRPLWPCADALDAWADLTDIGATYGVKPRHGHADCPDGPDTHEDYCLNGRQE